MQFKDCHDDRTKRLGIVPFSCKRQSAYLNRQPLDIEIIMSKSLPVMSLYRRLVEIDCPDSIRGLRQIPLDYTVLRMKTNKSGTGEIKQSYSKDVDQKTNLQHSRTQKGQRLVGIDIEPKFVQPSPRPKEKHTAY